MAHKDKAAYNEYMREYMLRRYRRRRSEALEKLGGACVDCGGTESLEVDHADRTQKGFNIGKAFAGFSERRLTEELAKCVLRCNACHKEKSLAEVGRISGKTSHGTLSSYRYCRCTECKKAKSEYARTAKLRTSGR